MIGKEYIKKGTCKSFDSKTKQVRLLINTTLYILNRFGVPVTGTPRRVERMAMVFLACADVKNISQFKEAKDSNHGFSLGTREIIRYVNENFSENISSGSYDDIRRKDLELLVLGDIVVRSNPSSATNDSTRGYSLNPLYAALLRKYEATNWKQEVNIQLAGVESIEVKLRRRRDIKKIPVTISRDKNIELSLGEHNELQKAIIESFLPQYGFGAEVLYVGDTTDKYLHLDRDRLNELNFFEILHEELPDVIAYSRERNWLYLIEAVHSSGPISETRLLKLKDLVKKCKAEVVYVTAFLDRKTFRKWTADIAWETEVWIADTPDHLIHFNGDKFLGPYKGS